MRITLPVVDRVIEAITAIVPDNPADVTSRLQSQGSPPAQVGWQHYPLTESLREFEPVLAAECNALDVYVVSKKRGYSTPDLIDHAEVMLSTDAVVALEDGILADVKAAGRCLAFDTPTAGGFHILRAVEAVMALYYKHVTGREIAKRHRNWGLYLKRLEKHPRADSKILGALEHIKENYRNPITHPEITLSEGDALMVFALSLSVIELMVGVLRTTTPTLSAVEEAKAVTTLAEQTASDGPDDF
jgi:hypothetical protein